jgi:hypothetical protein
MWCSLGRLRSTRTPKISLLTRVQSEFMMRGFGVDYIQPQEDHGKIREKQPADDRAAHDVKIRRHTQVGESRPAFTKRQSSSDCRILMKKRSCM